MKHFSLATQEPLQLKVLEAEHGLPLVHGAPADVLWGRGQVRHEGGRDEGEVGDLFQVFRHVLDLIFPKHLL